ncbi:MAG: hypothetical protein KatS3mg131_2154 [Candidatus Tectimicrobiota bacterium]|nr:MAG: hypothetical protein KatS3mg131_2154 [Candidatus Tectomicrobia bacterium]
MVMRLVLLLVFLLPACSVRSPALSSSTPLPATVRGQDLYGTLLDLRTLQAISFEAMLAAVAQVQVVAVGEEHYHPDIQAFELELLQALTRCRPQRLALAMEFLERHQQPIVDAYLAGALDPQALQRRLQASEAFMRLYFPLLRYARQAGLPVIAMNTPRRLARQIAREGLQATLRRLSPEERAYLPEALPALPPAYRTYFLEAVAGSHRLEGEQSERFVEASFVKDVTMALALATFLKAHPEHAVLAIAGRFHMSYDKAVPFFLRQYAPRLALRRLITLAVEPEETLDLDKLRAEDAADYLRLFPPAPEETKRQALSEPAAKNGDGSKEGRPR